MPDDRDVPAEFDLPRGIALAWGVAASPQRGPKREMSVERIVDAAVELADAEGLGAVSMAAVAKRLGFTPMSLYRYVSAKDDLLLLMMEEGTGVPSHAWREADGWRERLLMLYRELVAVYARHPWLLQIPVTGSPATPNNSEWVEAGLTALDETPLLAEEKLAVWLIVTGLSRWNGIVLTGYGDAARRSGRTAAEVAADEQALYEALVTPEAYPRLHAAAEAGVFASPYDPFVFGIERALDGVEAYMASLDRGEPHRLADEVEVLEDADVADDKKYRQATKAAADAEKAVLQAEKVLRQARKAQAQALKEARARKRD
ncbi:TetR family transcriptional regulator [Pseudoclavibacter endophyticus]|uniref:TetR/AcrR family transcriptional regulator n=1 Tax=Pseudoclavibacter endophyticus TaxID=1778590 RepID=A0A6H9WI34_9MICO|nr:TetR/AcrR family transcriptional regulator [Pseudoclavibacter endophyticus]KAB1648127.1 TetR/AcrR family transcriptional regulator [Pseudoclavibacter endophyticus]GGA69956.1 TetR family transcriptional regulator [Pseudoclavibacter endophyticus]